MPLYWRMPAAQGRFLSIVGSYGWGGKTVETLAGMIPNLKVQVLDPVMCKGYPKETDLKALEDLAATISPKTQRRTTGLTQSPGES